MVNKCVVFDSRFHVSHHKSRNGPLWPIYRCQFDCFVYTNPTHPWWSPAPELMQISTGHSFIARQAPLLTILPFRNQWHHLAARVTTAPEPPIWYSKDIRVFGAPVYRNLFAAKLQRFGPWPMMNESFARAIGKSCYARLCTNDTRRAKYLIANACASAKVAIYRTARAQTACAMNR